MSRDPMRMNLRLGGSGRPSPLPTSSPGSRFFGPELLTVQGLLAPLALALALASTTRRFQVRVISKRSLQVWRGQRQAVLRWATLA